MPAFPLLKVVQRIPRAFLRYPEREDAKHFLGVFVIEELECGHTQTVFVETDPLIARYRRCLPCEQGMAVARKPARAVSLEMAVKVAAAKAS